MSNTQPSKMSATNDRFAIVPLPPGTSPADALMIGPLDVIMQNLPDTHARADALNDLELHRIKADQIATMQQVSRGMQVASFCDSLNHLSARVDAEVIRRAERRRRDAEEAKALEEKQIADALSKLPDPDMPSSWSDDGELTTREPSQPEDEEQLAATETDNEGDLPDKLLEEVPPPLGIDPDVSGTRQPTARSPVAVTMSADALYASHDFRTQFVPDPVPRTS